ncbi:uncharacterized protein LOC142318021 isoform X1 [Lycorma delicatula]|uniref:uncharacterized protein LOC142318021 isoform X1 n=1 Tax=Lycorma delicatula TaxID=130591 RepID=UPI003F51172D
MSQSVDIKIQNPERPKELGKQKLSLERYSSMLEANLTRDQHTALTPSTDSPEIPLMTVISNKQNTTLSLPGKNPFEDDEDYSSGTPFDDDDDYDKNLNPFSINF